MLIVMVLMFRVTVATIVTRASVIAINIRTAKSASFLFQFQYLP